MSPRGQNGRIRMIEAFFLSKRLAIECRVNGTLRVLRHVPLLKKLLPADIYSKSWIKSLVFAFKILGEIFSFFLGKIIYLAMMVALPSVIIKEEIGSAADPGSIALHIFFCLTLLGTLMHNQLFDPSEEMFTAVFLLRMDAKKYSMSNYIYALIKDAAGFLPLLVLCRLLIPALKTVRMPAILLLPLLASGGKLIVSYLQLVLFRKKGFLFDGGAPQANKLFVAVMLLLFAAAYVPPAFGLALPQEAILAFSAAAVPAGIFGLIMLLKADDHRRVLKYIEFKNRALRVEGEQSTAKVMKESYLKKMDGGQAEDMLPEEAAAGKSGFAYFNTLFVRRHRRVLTRTAKRQAAVLAVAFALGAAACRFIPEAGHLVGANLPKILPASLFLMYILNRGETITQTLFFNCDSSMMNYNFYRRPDVILGIFTERLKTLVLINLLPAAVIAAGLPILYLVSGGAGRGIEYAVLGVAPLAMSVFFSVHYLTMYYLLQPYTDGLAQKGVAYRIVMILTYLVCYLSLQIDALRDNSLLFGIVVCLFAAAYVPAALLLTYKLAPRTFRLRL